MQQQAKIKVVVRKRPMLKKEQARGDTDIIDVRGGNTVTVRQNKIKVDLTKYVEEQTFAFDQAFSEHSTNEDIYLTCVRPLLQAAFKGAKVTCFAYGQTGSGKTFTMNGDPAGKIPGLYVLGGTDIFRLGLQAQNSHLAIYVSFFQIYCGKLFDLLNDRAQLQAREDAKQNVNIIGLQERKIENAKQFMQLLQHGSAVRITSSNSTNADSSRSHAILQISLRQKKNVFGKISFIDLAGCERGSDTDNASKQTRIDGAEINKSLLALKQCIRALDQGKTHTPFRGSKLTMVLKDSFVGFCKTLMIGNISPNSSSCENTLNTLRYADRVKQLKKGGGGGEPVSKQDMLAKQLMLPRMQKNSKKVAVNSDDEEEVPISKKMITEEERPPPLFPPAYRQANQLSAPRQDKMQEERKNSRPRDGSLSRHGRQQVVTKIVVEKRRDPESVRSGAIQPFKEIENNFHYPNSARGAFDHAGQVPPPRNQLELEELSKKNSMMIDELVQQENDLIQGHRQYLKGVVLQIRQKSGLLDQVTESGMQVKEYVGQLERLIDAQLLSLGTLKSRVTTLKRHHQLQSVLEQKLLRYSEEFRPEQGSLLDDIELLG